MQGQVFLKGWGLALPLFSFFKVYHFYILKLLYKVIISSRMQPTSADISRQCVVSPAADDEKLLYSLQNCIIYKFEGKLFFSATIIL